MSLRNTIGSADLEAKDFAFAQNTIAGLCADAEYFTHLLNAHHIGIKALDLSILSPGQKFFRMLTAAHRNMA